MLEQFLALRGMDKRKCMLLIGVAGRASVAQRTHAEVLHLARKHKGIATGRMLGEEWHKKRFLTPYLRNTRVRISYAVDTVETATTWDPAPALTRAIEGALR